MALATAFTIIIFILGISGVRRKTGCFYVVDIGVLFGAYIFAYTIVPAITFLFFYLEVPGWPWQELRKLAPTESEFAAHLWRHNLFMGVFFAAYFAIRKKVNESYLETQLGQFSWGGRALPLLILVFLGINAVRFVLHGHPDEYADKYTQIASMPPLLQATSAFLNRLNVGLQYLLFIAIATLRKGRLVALSLFAMTIFVIFLSSQGSRIETFFAVLAAFLLYNCFVRRIRLRMLVISGVGLGIFFGTFEVFRYYQFDITEAFLHLSEYGMPPPGEFGAVFGTGYHLYSLADIGQVPSADGRMFFYDFLSLFSANSDTEFSPQHWYARYFYPEASVPPQTNGPIADSAVWGFGEIDLTIRAVLLALIFAAIANRFFLHSISLGWLAVYLFFFSTSVMNIKYGIFWQLNPLVKTIFPTLFVAYLIGVFAWRRRRD